MDLEDATIVSHAEPICVALTCEFFHVATWSSSERIPLKRREGQFEALLGFARKIVKLPVSTAIE